MALVSRGVAGGTDINLLVDSTAGGDTQVVKLGVSTLGSTSLLPGDTANGLDVDVTNVIPGVTSTALGKAEDTPAVSGDTGVFILAVQRNTPISDAADGDYVGLHTDSSGRLQVTSSGVGGGAQVEDTPAATGDTGVFNLAVRRDVPTSGAAAGDYHEMAVDSLGRLWVSGTYAEDGVATTGDYGQFVLAVRRDTPTSGGAAGDYHELEVDALGRLWVSGTQAEDAVAASGDTGHFMLAVRRDAPVSGAAAGDYHEVQVDALGRLWTSGTYAEDAVAASGDYGKFMLAIRRDAPTSGAAAGDYHEIEVDALGRLWVSGTFAEDAVHASGDYGHFVMGVQSLARTARSADGDYTPFAVGAAGENFMAAVPEANAAWAATNYSALAAASGVIKVSAGKLLKVTLTNDNAAARYLQFFNLTAVPADATVPLFAVKLNIGETIELHWEPFGKYFTTGICWCNSTTGATKTIGTADSYVEATYL